MKSPTGEEREIKPAGVASLSHLGWEVVQAAADDARAPQKAPQASTAANTQPEPDEAATGESDERPARRSRRRSSKN